MTAKEMFEKLGFEVGANKLYSDNVEESSWLEITREDEIILYDGVKEKVNRIIRYYTKKNFKDVRELKGYYIDNKILPAILKLEEEMKEGWVD